MDMPETGEDTEVSEMGPFELLVMDITTAESPFAGAAVTVGFVTTIPLGEAAPSGAATRLDPAPSATMAVIRRILLT